MEGPVAKEEVKLRKGASRERTKVYEVPDLEFGIMDAGDLPKAQLLYQTRALYKGMVSDPAEDFSPSQFQRPAPPKIPIRSVLLALFLFFSGIFLLSFVFYGVIVGREGFEDRRFPMIVLGLMTIIPGAYHTMIFINAVRGVPGYSYEDIPGTIDDFGIGGEVLSLSSMANLFHEIYSELIRGMCSANCSGHGDCLNGTCMCEIKFAGEECGGVNINYHLGLASVYLVVALVSLIQLLIAITMSCRHVDKGNRIKEALSPTTPKAIYAVVFLAASLRSAYFAASMTWAADWLLSLLTAYYPLLLTGSSLIVCFWAEIFHLRNVCFESHRFLSKSFLGFVAFNVITYSILLAQLLLVLANNNETEKSYYFNVFNGCYAILLFIVVVFFLIYGVEVYFKIRGGFLLLSPIRTQGLATSKTDTVALVATQVDQTDRSVNFSQLHQSRLGLISQASMLLVTVVFILSDILGEFWKSKVPVESRNYHDILFRVVEVGVALWFPCVLWNVNRPDQLWILNPKKILQTNSKTSSTEMREDRTSLSESVGCYFCYDPDRNDAGPIIQPCECRGDVASVHHECLRRWLLQRAADNGEAEASCSVCKTPYKLEREKSLSWSACTDVSAAHWLKFSLMVATISGIFMSTWALCHILSAAPYKILVVGSAVIGTYVILKFLGQNTFSAYQQAKVSSVKIISRSPEVTSNTAKI